MRADLLARLRDAVGPDGVLDDPASMSGCFTDWRNAWSPGGADEPRKGAACLTAGRTVTGTPR